MKMDMYWSQQEVFLMGTLSLFPDKIKGASLTPDGEWQHYFNNKDFEQLAQQLNEYKEAGYIEFVEETVKVMPIGSNDAPNFRTVKDSFTITEVDSNKARRDLIEYLGNWRNDKLLTTTAYKPDNSMYQHDKLLTALARVYERQDMPRISIADVYGDNTDYEPPFWETVLTPQLVGKQYEIRQIGYDMNNREQPFVDIKVTDLKLHRSLELAAKSSEPIGEDDPEEMTYRGLRVKRDSLVDYNGTNVQLTGQETAALRVLMERPGELRLREDISVELTAKNTKPDNLAKLISSLRIKLGRAMGYNCIENKSGQGWTLKIHPLE